MNVVNRVARWHISKPNIIIWVNFRGIWKENISNLATLVVNGIKLVVQRDKTW
jgi:hypothetical protein